MRDWVIDVGNIYSPLRKSKKVVMFIQLDRLEIAYKFVLKPITQTNKGGMKCITRLNT